MRRIPALDGLRGVAIILVLATHRFGWPRGGQLGVDLFFILSGFLITSLLIVEVEHAGRISLRSFYARRAARLLPGLALLLCVYLVAAAAKGTDGPKAVLLGALYFGNIVQAFTDQRAFVGASGLGHLWSLAEEEQFYLVWPLLLPLAARLRRPGRAVAMLAGLLVVYKLVLWQHGAGHPRLYNGPDTHAEGLVMGAAAAFLLARTQTYKIRSGALVAAFPVVVFFLAAREPHPVWDAVCLPLAELSLLAFLLAALTLPAFASPLSVAPLRFFGRISYSLYLWNSALIWIIGGHGPLVAAASIVIAYGSTRWLEEPVRRRFRRPEARPTVAAAAAATG